MDASGTNASHVAGGRGEEFGDYGDEIWKSVVEGGMKGKDLECGTEGGGTREREQEAPGNAVVNSITTTFRGIKEKVEGDGPTYTDGTTICAICLDTLDEDKGKNVGDDKEESDKDEAGGNVVGTLKRCGHRYHKECMAVWLRGKRKRDAVCPECRTWVVE